MNWKYALMITLKYMKNILKLVLFLLHWSIFITNYKGQLFDIKIVVVTSAHLVMKKCLKNLWNSNTSKHNGCLIKKKKKKKPVPGISEN